MGTDSPVVTQCDLPNGYENLGTYRIFNSENSH